MSSPDRYFMFRPSQHLTIHNEGVVKLSTYEEGNALYQRNKEAIDNAFFEQGAKVTIDFTGEMYIESERAIEGLLDHNLFLFEHSDRNQRVGFMYGVCSPDASTFFRSNVGRGLRFPLFEEVYPQSITM